MDNKKSFISNINNKINALSKTTILMIVVVYTAVLSLLVVLGEPNPSYINVPSYEHVYFDDKINTQITLIANRKFDDEGNMTLKYNITVNIHGRPSEESNSDPSYSITNFKMSAGISDKQTGDIKSMYYFSEQSKYTTPISHSYSIDNSSENQHPLAFYTKVQYKKNTTSGVATFKEDIWLKPSEKDIEELNKVYNIESDAKSFNLFGKDDSKLANIQFIKKQSTTKDNVYNCGVKITMETLSYTSKHHIDMQTWVETVDGEYLPFIGAYGYTNQRSNYVQSGRELYHELKPKYICIKAVQVMSDGSTKTTYYKQDFNKLSDAFTTNPSADDVVVDNQINNPITYIAIGSGVAIVLTFVIMITVYFYNNKKKKEQEISQEIENKQEN